jgi:hypothetical protein
VIAPKSRLLRRRYRLAIDRQRVCCADQRRRMRDDRAVERYAPGFDQSLGIAARGHSGTRQEFRDALFSRGCAAPPRVCKDLDFQNVEELKTYSFTETSQGFRLPI